MSDDPSITGASPGVPPPLAILFTLVILFMIAGIVFMIRDARRRMGVPAPEARYEILTQRSTFYTQAYERIDGGIAFTFNGSRVEMHCDYTVIDRLP